MMKAGGRQRYQGQFRPEYSRLHQDRDLIWVVPFPVHYMVGVVGYRFVGKSTVLSYLNEKHGFRLYNLSSSLRAIAAERGIPLEPRSRLQDLGDEVRAEARDGAVLARGLLRSIRADLLSLPPGQPPPRIAVGGFKHPEEVSAFEQLQRFKLIAVEANEETRFKRAFDSGILAEELSAFPGPPEPTLKSFRDRIESRDQRGGDNPWTRGYGQAVEAVMGNVTEPGARIVNQGELSQLHAKVKDRVLALNKDFSAIQT
jgi:hypothetical protein